MPALSNFSHQQAFLFRSVFLRDDAVGSGGNRGSREDPHGLTRLDAQRSRRPRDNLANDFPGPLRAPDRVAVHGGVIKVRKIKWRNNILGQYPPQRVAQFHPFRWETRAMVAKDRKRLIDRNHGWPSPASIE